MAWYTWAGGDCTSTATSSNTWTSWACDSTATTSGSVWVKWSGGYAATTSSVTYADNVAWEGWSEKAEETAEQKKARLERENTMRLENEARQKRMSEEYEKERKRWEEADKKAMDTLMETLDDGQKAMLLKDGSYVVLGEKTKKKYRIKPGTMVDELDEADEKKVKSRLCFHPANPKIPKHDTALSQTLMLRWAEDAALKMANRHQVY